MIKPEPVLVYSEPYVEYSTDSVQYETIVQLCNNTDKATVCSFSSRALLQNLRQTSPKSHDFRTSGEIPSGPPALPAFSEDFTFLYSSIVKGPSSISRSSKMLGIPPSVSTVLTGLSSRFLRCENHVCTLSSGQQVRRTFLLKMGLIFRSALSLSFHSHRRGVNLHLALDRAAFKSQIGRGVAVTGCEQ